MRFFSKQRSKMAYNGELFLLCGLFFVPVHSRIYNVSSPLDLGEALQNCQPGDKILIRPGTYRGEFVFDEIGEGKSHTLITSATQDAKSVVFQGRGKDPTVTIKGSRWALTKITIANKLGSDIGTGVVVKKDQTFLKGLIIRDVDTAVYSTGANVAIENCEIHASKMGLYTMGNGSVLSGSRIYGPNPCIFVDDMSCCGVVKGNRCDQEDAVFVNGQDYEMDAKTKEENDKNRVVDEHSDNLKAENFIK